MSYLAMRFLGETGDRGPAGLETIEAFYREHDNTWLEAGSNHADAKARKGSAR